MLANENNTKFSALKKQLDTLESTLKSELDRAIKNKVPASAQACSTFLMQIADAKQLINSSDNAKETNEIKIKNYIEGAVKFTEMLNITPSSIKESLKNLKTNNQNFKPTQEEQISEDNYKTPKY